MSTADALDAFRQAIVAGEGTLSCITLLDAAGSPTTQIRQATTVRITPPSSSSSQAVDYAAQQPTRIATNQSLLSSGAGGILPSTHPDSFLPLSALVFAVQTQDESNPTYARLATEAGAVRLGLIERQPILDYLCGRTEQWAGVLSKQAQTQQQHQQAQGDTGTRTAGEEGPGSTSLRPTDSSDAAGAAAAGIKPPVASTTPPGSPSASHKAKYAKANGAAAGAGAGAGAHASGAASGGVKRPYVPNKGDADYVKRLRRDVELVLRDRNDSMRGTGTGGTAAVSSSASAGSSVDFTLFRGQIATRLELLKRLATGSGSRGAPAPASAAAASSSAAGGASASGAAGSGARRQRAQDPIILLSNSPTAMINMFNVKAFLEEGTFLAPELAKKEARGSAEPVVSVQHRPASFGASARPLRFLVVDNADTLAKLGAAGGDPWQRVVAVFTTGQKWQFKPYRHSEPGPLFRACLGVYARWHNEQPSPEVKDWNVSHVVIDRNKRYTDKQVSAAFWRSLESWIKQKKPHLMQ